MFESVRSFRRNAVHARQALEALEQGAGAISVERGYLGESGLIERYKRLSIPVRRALNHTDRASFAAALAELEASARTDEPAMWRPAAEAWQALQAELDSQVVLGGSRVPRRQILGAWLDAAAFYDKLDRDRAYDHLIDQWGTAAEGIGAELMESTARVVIQLDQAAAAALGEPVILPPPVRTPPPPPDPKESWWRRLLGTVTHSAD
ncbi:MAG TPA: hypothetical protein VMM93_04135 [Vicinamibacterales bacterium]|nr:hypothetical protein [Vicinamibacterales bacterium]